MPSLHFSFVFFENFGSIHQGAKIGRHPCKKIRSSGICTLQNVAHLQQVRAETSLLITQLQQMRKLIQALFQRPKLNHLSICPNHLNQNVSEKAVVNQSLPYSTDHCKSCNKDMCLSCSQVHVNNNCQVQLKLFGQLGQGVLKSFNLGQVIKVDLNKVYCICGKKLSNHGSAICAACGMASCSQACHHQWQKMGNCIFVDNFYNIPEGFTMRSILLQNIQRIRASKIKQWVIANRSGTTMVCCYAHSQHPYVFLQRGFRSYGIPNPSLISQMTPEPRALDYFIHFQRRCDCQCKTCKNRSIHSSTNCQASCLNFDMEYMRRAILEPENHKQCRCTCKFCSSGVIFNTHRIIDCSPFCERRIKVDM